MERVSQYDVSRVTLFRIVRTVPPTLWDFQSYRERGIPLRHDTVRGRRLWDGLSLYRTREQAARIATISPRVGSYIAELSIPTDGSFRLELDNGDYGHCTVWGDADVLMSLVVSIAQA